MHKCPKCGQRRKATVRTKGDEAEARRLFGAKLGIPFAEITRVSEPDEKGYRVYEAELCGDKS